MLRLKPINRPDFSTLILESSFLLVEKSQSYQGWYEQIKHCSNNKNTFLIEYLFHEKVWLSFLINSESNTVAYMQREPIPQDTIISISNGTVLKLWLQLKKKYCLHTSGIRLGEQVALFIGSKGAGKSTTAAYFNSKGFDVWCDDFCVLEAKQGAFYALPGERQLKVKTKTIKGLSIPEHQLSEIYLPVPHIESVTTPVAKFKSYYKSQEAADSERNSLKVKAIFILMPRVSEGGSIVRSSHKLENLKVIMDEIMLRDIVSKEYMGYYFEQTKKLIDTVKIYKVQATDNLAEIDNLFKSILGVLALNDE